MRGGKGPARRQRRRSWWQQRRRGRRGQRWDAIRINK